MKEKLNEKQLDILFDDRKKHCKYNRVDVGEREGLDGAVDATCVLTCETFRDVCYRTSVNDTCPLINEEFKRKIYVKTYKKINKLKERLDEIDELVNL